MSFKAVLGHSREISILKSAFLSGKVPHSLLFSGPEGIGKRQAALAYAKLLNCSNSGEDACGTCPDCQMMDALTHPNLLQVWPTVKDKKDKDLLINTEEDGVIRIEQVREVQNALKYRVDRGRKIVIIAAADKLMPQAANAFLKTLEEPPSDSVIILVSSKASDLLPTILSRCQRINFRPLPDDIIASYLTGRSGMAREDAMAISRLSSGSLSRAVKYTDEGANAGRRELLERLAALRPEDLDVALKLAEDLSKRDDLEEVLEFMKSWYRDKAVSMEGSDGLVINSDMKDFIGSTGGDFRRLWDAFTMIEKTRRDIMPPRYANRQLSMEALIMRLL